MREHFEKEVEELKSNLIRMASLVDGQVEHAFTALETGDIDICRGIKAKDSEIDAYDNLIQAECENVLALFQPVAIDLRFIISTLMINNQLERCGDIAINICQRVKKTGEYHQLIVESQILDMGKQAKEMVKNAIDSFITNSSDLAKSVLVNDQKVDDYNKQIFKFLVAKMQSDNKLIEPCSHLIVLTRNIERLADHATNIAENLVFYVEANIVAHRKKIKSFEESSEKGKVV